MKKTLKFFGIITFLAIIAMAGCKDPGTDENINGSSSTSPTDTNLDLSGNVTITSPINNIVTGVELTANYDGTEEVTIRWQWNKDGSVISNETNATYTPWEGGSYTVTASANGYNGKTSAAVTVTLFTPTVGLYAKAPPILPGDTPIDADTVAANDVAAAVTYVKTDTTTPYTLIINQDINCVPQTLDVTNVKLTIIGIGGERKINLSSNGVLFTVGASGQTGIELTIGNDVTLVGRKNGQNGATADNNNAVVNVQNGGSFIMQDGSKVTGNRSAYSDSNAGAAVNIDGGTLTMNGGAITGNDINHPATGVGIIRTSGLRTNGTAIINLNGGSISGNTGSGAGIDIVLVPEASFNLSGSAVIGAIGLHSVTTHSVINIAPSWSGNIGKLHLFGNGGDINAVINLWETNVATLQGTGVNAAAIARITLGDFYRSQGTTGSAGLNKPITDTHKIADSGADIGKVVRIAFISAPTLSLAAGNAELTYTWTASNPAADSYDVYYKSGSGLTADDVKTGTKITGATSGGKITGLTNNTTYSVVVVANKTGYTKNGDSAVQTGTPALLPFTTAPSASLTPGNTELTYTWTASNPVADSYDVYWKAGSGLTAENVKTGTKITGATSGGKITGLTNGATYSVVVTANKAGYTSIDSAVETVIISSPYFIKVGSTSTTFTATKGSINGATVGTANQPIQDVINAIRTDAAGKDCTIQFGDGATALDIGTNPASFNNTGGTWGLVELSGKITGNSTTTNLGTIVIIDAVSITSTADIANTAASTNARTIFHNSTGTLTISGGTVQANMGIAAYIFNTGKIIVSGTAKVTSAIITTDPQTSGTIQIANFVTTTNVLLEITGGTVENTAAKGNAIFNSSLGAVNISGGTVSATTGVAVYNMNTNTGKVTVSGTALVTSANTDNSLGTICLNDSGNTDVRLEITGGTVENTTTNGTAIFNNSSGEVKISGGKVSATTGVAVYNQWEGKVTVSQAAGSTTLITSANTKINNNSVGTIYLKNGTLEITGGTVENTVATGNAIYNSSTKPGTITISGGTVSATTGYAVYNYSSGSITISDGTVTATGYAVYNDSSGSITISGGTVTATGSSGRAIYNYSTGAINISGGMVTATGDYGRAILNSSNGTVTVSAGTVSATGTSSYSIYNNSTGTVTVTSPPAVIIGARYP